MTKLHCTIDSPYIFYTRETSEHEMHIWCKENLGDEGVKWEYYAAQYGSPDMYDIVIYIDDEIDAAAFKLRWG